MKIYYFEGRGFSVVFDAPGDGAELAAKAQQSRCIRTKLFESVRAEMRLHAWATSGDVLGIWAVVAASARIARSIMEDMMYLTHLDKFEIVGAGEAVQPIDVALLSRLSTAVIPDSRRRHRLFRVASQDEQRASVLVS
jgi:hypothetical protein